MRTTPPIEDDSTIPGAVIAGAIVGLAAVALCHVYWACLNDLVPIDPFDHILIEYAAGALAGAVLVAIVMCNLGRA